MLYDWFYIFNAAEFALLSLVSKTYTVSLEGIGEKEALVTQGNYLGVTYDGVFLPINLDSQNPFKLADISALQSDNGDTFAIEIDNDNNVFLGVLVR